MTSCRILVVAATVPLGFAFVERVKALQQSNKSSTEPTSVIATPDSVASNVEDGLHIVPWTLTNKYYTADVHFAIVDTVAWRLRHTVGVPAMVFVWAAGEPFEETLRRMSEGLVRSAIDPEVSLAVCVEPLGPLPTKSLSKRDRPPSETSENLDEYISTCGFEYVNGTDDSRAEDTDIPTLPRVIDAFSTIMWSSMVQTANSSSARRESRPMNLLNLDAMDEGGLAALLRAAQADSHDDGVAELEKWLEEDEDESLSDDFGEDVKTPGPNKTGFEDDFAAFVSAPAVNRDSITTVPTSSTSTIPAFTITSTQSSSSEPLPLDPDSSFGSTYDFDQPSPGLVSQSKTATETSGDQWTPNRLAPMHTGASWTSFHSMSDIGDQHSEAQYTPLQDHGPESRSRTPKHDEDDDAELPSEAEIHATSARIFGAPVSTSNEDLALAAVAGSSQEEDVGDTAFDLTRVLTSLEGMKAEIAEIPDEDARRQAAARVALGLVYGLGLEDRT